MKLVDSDYLQRSASDDYMLPCFIETMMKLADQWPAAGIVSCPLLYINENDDSDWSETPGVAGNAHVLKFGVHPGFYPPEQFREILETGSMSSMASLSASTIFKTELVRELGNWPADLGMHEVSFILRAAGLHSGMAYVDTPLYMWVFRQKGLTGNELADRYKNAAFLRRNAEKMMQPPFDKLFSDAFRSRWDRESEPATEAGGSPPVGKTTWWNGVRARFFAR